MQKSVNSPNVDLENNMMRNVSVPFLAPLRRRVATVIAIAGCVVLMHVDANAAQPVIAETFPSAEQAARALYLAARNNDREALGRILGTDTEAVSSEDPIADQAERERFVRKYQEMHRLVRDADGANILHIGAENWPFPFPLVSEDGAWHFDPTGGMEEVVLRRIGEDELAVIGTCRTLANGARRARNGSAMQPLAVKIGNDGRVVPFHGYYMRRVVATSKSPATGAQREKSATTSRFTYVAYPVEYRVTGVMTFAIARDGAVYESDLGADTVELARKISGLDSNHAWHRVEEQ